MSLLQEGQIIRETYEVERLLGAGAFAEVYRVRHRFLGRQAMKVFKQPGLTLEEIEQNLEEARLLSQLGHPNVIRVFDANVTETSDGQRGFFTMEYMTSGNLEQFWRSHEDRFVPVETTVNIIRQVCEGLALAHSETPPIIHRDIKPQNILIGYMGDNLRAKISDFGLAKRVNPLTLMASARGTRLFKPPEAFRHPQSDSRAGDVWAVGMTLYMLLTDQVPFSSDNDMDSFDFRSFERPLVSPSHLNILVSPDLDHIASRSLALRTEARYSSALEMLDDLSKWRPGDLQTVAQSEQSTGADRNAEKQSSAPSSNETGKGIQSTGVQPTGQINRLAAHLERGPEEQARAFVTPSVFNLEPTEKNLEEQAREMARRAVAMARQSGRLNEAINVMEEAFEKFPDLRNEFEYRVRLWRRGLAM